MKTKVVHTRLSEDLFEKIVDKAQKNHTNVSSLVRGAVEDFFDISTDVIDIQAEKLRKRYFHDRGKKADKKKKQGIIGYQPITLAAKTYCAITGKKMAKGEKAYLAFWRDDPDGKIVSADFINFVKEK